MTAQTNPESGQKWVRCHQHYEVVAVEDGIVKMSKTYAGSELIVEETLTRFQEEVEAGRAVHHLECIYCGLTVNPDNAAEEALHYRCWFQNASVKERCEAEVNRVGGNRLASEALRADEDPREHLLKVIGDPARTFHDRTDAENLLTHAVSVKEISDASVLCPNCREGEAFEMDPTTGAVHCHCGELLQEAD